MPPWHLPSIGRAIGFAFASTLLLMALLVGLTLYEIQRTKEARQLLIETLSPAINSAQQVQLDLTRLDDGLHITLLTWPPTNPGTLPSLQAANAQLGRDVDELERHPSPDREAAAMAQLRQNADGLRKASSDVLDRAIRFGPDIALHEYKGSVQPGVGPTLQAAQQVQALKEDRERVIREALAVRGDQLGHFLLIGFFVAFLVCVLVARATIQMITVPARRLVIAARVLEHGEYDRAIHFGVVEAEADEPANEIARLRQSFVRMARALQEREERLIEQARHLEAANNRLSALQAITDVGLTRLDLDTLLQQLLERVVQATSAQAGAILLLDEAGRLRARAASGRALDRTEATFEDMAWLDWLRPDAEPLLLPQSSGASVPEGRRQKAEGSPGKTSDESRADETSRPGTGPAASRPRSSAFCLLPSSTGPASLLVLALVASERAIGLAYLDGGRPEPFGEEAIALMRVFGERAALAIERSRAFAELENWNQILSGRLAEQQEKLVRTERLASLGLIGAGIAHELRNPLGVITNSVYYLRQRLRDADEKLTRHAEILEREVAHAVRIIDNLVQFSRESPPYAYPVALRPVFEASLERIHPPAAVDLETALPEDLPRVRADEHRLVQVLENLLRNAIQAVDGQGKIRLQAERAGECVAISVQDSGPGIAPEYRDRLFEPLVSTKVKGMGLGLALSKKMVEAWGGSIEATSPPEGGTIFRILLPAVLPEGSRREPGGEEAISQDSVRLRR